MVAPPKGKYRLGGPTTRLLVGMTNYTCETSFPNWYEQTTNKGSDLAVRMAHIGSMMFGHMILAQMHGASWIV